VKKLLQIGVSMREHMQTVASREPGQVVLHRPNLIQQPQRIERGQHGTQPLLHGTVDCRRDE
jgi:hypothetical protein